MIKIVDGDLLQAKEKIRGHQTNTETMRSGIAGLVKQKYKEAFEAHQTICKEYEKKPEELLGVCQLVECHDSTIIANLFGQSSYGSATGGDGTKYTDVPSLRKSIETMKIEAQLKGYSVALPYNIGCVRGGADWDTEVFPMIEEVFSDYDITLYKYNG